MPSPPAAEALPVRVVIEDVRPEVDGGRFAVKRVVGDRVVVEAAVFAEGHDELIAEVQYRAIDAEGWQIFRMRPLGNDQWRAELSLLKAGSYVYRLRAWPDAFRSWQRDLTKRVGAAQDVAQELLAGAALIREAATRAEMQDATRLSQRADALERTDWAEAAKIELALDEELPALVDTGVDVTRATVYDRQQRIVVDRERAGFSAWYELFPRSTGAAGEHGTFRTAIDRLPYIASLGFDVLYLPPIHPIGVTKRKGKNNATECEPDDVGSPWAIGSSEGGHTSINPKLGTAEDFRALVAAAKERGIEVALDIALQASPDHPWVKQHPSWFKHRPDGSVRYAENPPKKYEDIYPIDFESADWQSLWAEVEGVFRHWIRQGVTIFRVDNPHTKPFAFWEWLIERLHADHSEVLFLAEAFTRPHPMQYLAKVGFSQSYTYFTWRNTKWELTQYLNELTRSPQREYFRPNFWPNTPDILHESLQVGGRAACITRFVLAATLSGNYGIYGPAFELGENTPREANSEEYASSEKYELRHWDIDAVSSIGDIIRRVNRLRRETTALQHNETLRWLEFDNDQVIAYAKADDAGCVIVVANLDPQHTQAGWLRLPLSDLGVGDGETYQLHDIIDDARYSWTGERNYVELNPSIMPVHVFRLRRRLRREHDFDYYQ